jgi:hypothetical protein
MARMRNHNLLNARAKIADESRNLERNGNFENFSFRLLASRTSNKAKLVAMDKRFEEQLADIRRIMA